MSKIRFTKEKIESCPFCGGKSEMNHETINCGHNEYHEHIYIKCTICGARSKGVEDPYFSSNHYVTEKVEAAALQQWNRRAVNPGYIDTDSVYSGCMVSGAELAKVKEKINSFFGKDIVSEIRCTVDPIQVEIDMREKFLNEVKKVNEAKIACELIESRKLVPVLGWMFNRFKENEVYCCCAETRDFILSNLPYAPKIFVVNCLPSAELYIVKDPELKEQFLSILAKKGGNKMKYPTFRSYLKQVFYIIKYKFRRVKK